MNLVLRPEAEQDIADAQAWYEDRQPGLGLAFLEAVDAALAIIIERPRIHQPVYRSLRRSLVRRFPYAIYFRIENDTIIVVGVLYQRRSPVVWRRRSRL